MEVLKLIMIVYCILFLIEFGIFIFLYIKNKDSEELYYDDDE